MLDACSCGGDSGVFTFFVSYMHMMVAISGATDPRI